MHSRGLQTSISCNRNPSRSYVPQLRWQNVKPVTARWVQGNMNPNLSIAQFMLKMLSLLFSASLLRWYRYSLLNLQLDFVYGVDSCAVVSFLLFRERSNATSCLALLNRMFCFDSVVVVYFHYLSNNEIVEMGHAFP